MNSRHHVSFLSVKHKYTRILYVRMHNNLVISHAHHLGDNVYFDIGNHWLSGEYRRDGLMNGYIRLRKVEDPTKCFFKDGRWWLAWCEHESGWVTSHQL